MNRKHVAEKAGVSVATVSRALNGTGYVSDHKREIILKVVDELKYQPNPIAISLKRNKSHQLLFCVRELSNCYYIEMYKGICDYAKKSGYMVIISNVLDHEQIACLMVDGIILQLIPASDLTYIEKLRFPTVVASYGKKLSAKVSYVDLDVTTAIEIAVTYLRSMGHKRIAYAADRTEIPTDNRHLAYMELLSPVLGTEFSRYILGPYMNDESKDEINYFENGIIAATQFIDRSLDATAIVAFNDDTAMGIISHFHSRGIRVPEDVSVIGIDDHFASKYFCPPLTTVSISPYAHGVECARVLIELLEGKTLVEAAPIEIKLVERDSVKKI